MATTDQPQTEDGHADVRFFKLLEVAYNLARNEYYERAKRVGWEAVAHYEETMMEE